MTRLILPFLLLPLLASGQTARPAVTGVSHLSVYTTDASKTEHFYVHDLGAVKRSDPQNPAGVRYYFSPIQFVEVLPMPAGAPPKLRFDHTAFNTSSAERMRLYLSEHQIQVPTAVTRSSDGSQFFDVTDPEGNLVQFIQPPAHPEAVAANPLSSHIIHVGFIVHQQPAEDAFYLGVLGFKPYWHGGPSETETSWVSMQVPDGHDWLEYMIVKGPETTGIPAAMSQENAGVLDHFSLGVPNIEKATNLLAGNDRLNARHSDPKIGRDGKWQLNIYDPDGIRAEVMEFQPSIKPCCSAFMAPSPIR